MKRIHSWFLRISLPLTALTLAALCGGSPPAAAQDRGARLLHGNGEEFFFFTSNEDETLVAEWTFRANPGNFLRQEVDGTFRVHLRANDAEVRVFAFTAPDDAPPIATGRGKLQLSSTADVEFFPDGGFAFSLTAERINAQGDGELVDLASGEACALEVRLIVRDGEAKKDAFGLECD
jgi:hypothetical protein